MLKPHSNKSFILNSENRSTPDSPAIPGLDIPFGINALAPIFQEAFQVRIENTGFICFRERIFASFRLFSPPFGFIEMRQMPMSIGQNF